jgi:hypothetical protein
MVKIKIHNNKCTICGEEVKKLTDMANHYKCFEKED